LKLSHLIFGKVIETQLELSKKYYLKKEVDVSQLSGCQKKEKKNIGTSFNINLIIVHHLFRFKLQVCMELRPKGNY